jgi:glycosyltransferase involved in cell wall biosynthesis
VRILLVHNSFRSFVEVDRDILASEHDVEELDLSNPWRIVTLPIRLARNDLVFNWFASLHSLLPTVVGRLMGKKVITVAGGYDTASEPDINFGHMRHPWKQYVVRVICRLSTVISTKSFYALDNIQQNVHPKTPVIVTFHGVRFPPQGPAEREPLVITIGQIRRVNLSRKGLEVFAKAAALVPEARFIMAGEILDDSIDYLRSIAPPNLEIRGKLSLNELDELYARASVYVQASSHESFGLTVVEAMAAGAFVVVSRRASLPEVAGPDAVFVDETDPASVADGIRIALARPPELRAEFARQARERYPLERRRKELLSVVDGVLTGRLG